jgi:hypothetical protein
VIHSIIYFNEMFLVSVMFLTMSWGSVVSIVTGYGLDGQRVWSSDLGRGKIFIFSMSSRLSEAHPASYPMGVWGSFPRGKAAGV